MPLNNNAAGLKELMSLEGIHVTRASEIIKRWEELGGHMTEYDLKSITKISLQVWQLVLDTNTI